MTLHQPGGPDQLPAGQRVPDRVIGQPVPLVPGRRVAVQSCHLARLFLPEAGLQQVGEQMVVAPLSVVAGLLRGRSAAEVPGQEPVGHGVEVEPVLRLREAVAFVRE
jgi:hypothetical protein